MEWLKTHWVTALIVVILLGGLYYYWKQNGSLMPGKSSGSDQSTFL